jgi:hypothetical protein
MPIVSQKTWNSVLNGTLLIDAPGETGSAFQRASYSEDTAPGTAVIQSGAVVPGQNTNNTIFYQDPTSLASPDQTVVGRFYTGDHGFGQISVFVQRTGGISTGYSLDWAQGINWSLKKNGTQVATAGASSFHDQNVDISVTTSEPAVGSRRIRLTIRRVSDAFYYNGGSFQAGAVDLIDYTDAVSPITAIGVSGFGMRMNTATPHTLTDWSIDGTPTTAANISSPTGSVTSSTTALCGFTTDTLSTGSAYFLRRTGGAAQSGPTIIATGESQAITGVNPQTRSVTLLNDTANQFIDIVQTGPSNVLTVGPFSTVKGFIVQPSDSTVTGPNTASFSATYVGTIVGHQWQVSTNGGGAWANVVDGLAQSGGAGSGGTVTYTTTATAVSSGNHQSGYQYRCVLDPSGTPVNSNAAVLTVNVPASPATAIITNFIF